MLNTYRHALFLFIAVSIVAQSNYAFAQKEKPASAPQKLNEASMNAASSKTFEVYSGVGEVVHAVRNGGGCKLPAPEYENVQDVIVDTPKHGKLVDGGIGFMDSRTCKTRVFARGFKYISDDGFVGEDFVTFREIGRKKITVIPQVESEFAKKKRLEREAAEKKSD